MKFTVTRSARWPFSADVRDQNYVRICTIQPHTYSTADKTKEQVDARPENWSWLGLLAAIEKAV